MSASGRQLLDALAIVVVAALPNCKVTFENRPESDIPPSDLKFPNSVCSLLLTDYNVETLDYRQKTRKWFVTGYLYEPNERDRVQVMDDLESVRDELAKDDQLGQMFYRTSFFGGVAHSHIDATRFIGIMDIDAEITV